MVGYEDKFKIEDFLDKILEYRNKNPQMKFYYHAGETRDDKNQNVIDAIVLGTKRIGHGLTVARNQVILDLVRENDICVELNPLSNLLLGYVKDLHWHPGKVMIANGLRITINPDDYLNWDVNGVTFDYFLAMLYMGFDLIDVKYCLDNSIKYSSLGEEDKLEV